MRIALISVSGQLGGSEGVLLELIGELRRLRSAWDVRLLMLAEGPLEERAAALGAAVTLVPMPSSLASFGEWAGRSRAISLVRPLVSALGGLREYQQRVSQALAAIDPDIVHTTGFKAHLVAARLRTRAVRLWHMHEYVSQRPLTRRLIRRYGSCPDVIVANSLSVAKDVTSVVNERLRRPVRVIHNGVDLTRFTPDGPVADIDAACGLRPAPPGTVRVGLAGTFARWKGHETFLRALARIGETAQVRGYIIGGPLYDTAGSQWSMEELQGIARTLGLESRLGFTGFQPDMPPFFRALDVVVHASTDPEPFGLAIAEAMAAGRAVVTTGSGGAGEIVQSNETALVHPPGDVRRLADAIEQLARDAARRAHLGRAARAAVTRRFSAMRFGEAFVHLYESLR